VTLAQSSSAANVKLRSASPGRVLLGAAAYLWTCNPNNPSPVIQASLAAASAAAMFRQT